MFVGQWSPLHLSRSAGHECSSSSVWFQQYQTVPVVLQSAAGKLERKVVQDFMNLLSCWLRLRGKKWVREEAKGRSEEKNTARDVEEWKREGNEVPRGYWKKKRKGKKGNRMGIKQERKKRRQKREKVKKEVHTCYVDSWDVGVGKLSKCILTFIGEKSVTLKCNGCLYIIQATPKLACHLERETKETQSHCPLGPPHRSTLHNYYQLGVPLWSWLCSPLHAECSLMAAGCWGWRQCKGLHSAGSSYGNSGHM